MNAPASPPVNSQDYWDHRFDTDWDANDGRRQSRFFGRLAAEHLPGWLVHEIRSRSLTVCDWGCAEGDGTDALSQFLGVPVTGIDFSHSAIARARSHYPQLPFSTDDLLTRPAEPRFDVLFSSNTLEHFAHPWTVFRQLAPSAAEYVVALVPYREFERFPEHEVTFEAASIPAAPEAGWVVVFSKVMDTRAHQPCFWPGEQLLVVFARTEVLERRRFSLAQMEIETDANTPAKRLLREQARSRTLEQDAESLQKALDRTQQALEAEQVLLQQAEAALETSRQETADQIAATGSLRSALAELQSRRAAAEQEAEAARHQAQALADQAAMAAALAQRRIDDLRLEVDTLLATKSWRWSAPLRRLHTVLRWARQRGRDVQRAYRAGGVATVWQRSRQYVARRRMAAATGVPSAVHPVGRPAPAALRTATAVRPPPPAARGDKPDVWIFSIIDWHFRTQRPQHLARELARAGHRVFFFSNHFVDDRQAGFDIEPLAPALPLFQVKLQVSGAPQIYFAAASDAALAQMVQGLRQFATWARPQRWQSIVQHAFWLPLARAAQAGTLIYDCMDHHEGFGNVPPSLLALEEELVTRADLLVVTSGWIEDHFRGRTSALAVVRNAAEYTHFCTAPTEVFADPDGRRVIGYYGAIAPWFDVALVRALAERFTDCLVLLVGDDTIGARAALAGCPNVQFTGEVPYARLPYYLYGMDVCLLPFQVLPLTLATNPVKVYEYLSAGKPVVSVDLPELAQFDGLVRVASDADGFLTHTAAALAALPEHPDALARRRAFAERQTWAHRAAALQQAAAAAPLPRISVIVLTYNNLELTQRCLDSIDRRSHYANLEIVVVDNASTDGSPDYLRNWAEGRDDVRLILSDHNTGFAGGNNLGMAAASGDYLILLNNDTVVTDGWAGRLVGHLRDNPEIGLVGPVTNNIGNEARIETTYSGLDAMPAEAQAFTLAHLGDWFEIPTAAFFCVAMPRRVYEQAGGLCTDYGRGFFEDDDYCRRVEALGLKVACAEDVFVHHHLSASFDQLGAARKQQLFDENRAIYEAKWGPWVPHRYRQR